jgi:hypothetical protein
MLVHSYVNDITDAADNSQEVITGAEAGVEFEENGFVVVCYCSAYCSTSSILTMLMCTMLLSLIGAADSYVSSHQFLDIDTVHEIEQISSDGGLRECSSARSQLWFV